MYPLPDATGYLASCATKSGELAKARDWATPVAGIRVRIALPTKGDSSSRANRPYPGQRATPWLAGSNLKPCTTCVGGAPSQRRFPRIGSWRARRAIRLPGGRSTSACGPCRKRMRSALPGPS